MIYGDIQVFGYIDHLFDIPKGYFYAVKDCFCEKTWSHSPQFKIGYCQQCPNVHTKSRKRTWSQVVQNQMQFVPTETGVSSNMHLCNNVWLLFNARTNNKLVGFYLTY